jgi:glutaredoxin-related protein
MSPTTLLVKNMVCHRCVLAVEQILAKESIPFEKVSISQSNCTMNYLKIKNAG